MNKFILFVKACDNYRVWLTTKLPLSTLWLFILTVQILYTGIRYIPLSQEVYLWHSIILLFEGLAVISLAVGLFVSMHRGLQACERRSPWILPITGLSLAVIAAIPVIRKKGCMYLMSLT